ncbi:hypothetical protein [Pueribacillus sp. YX66]|uniref:hypothetical protein n=1 Tax=Pueribacillus sp. YX66 TaxID=3229242 RepID=UPI00358CF6E8
MKKLVSTSFNTVQNIISKDEVEELYKNKSKKLKSRDVLMFFVFYFILIAPLYFFYFIRMGIVKGYENYPEEFTISLDLNNNFILFINVKITMYTFDCLTMYKFVY